MAQRPPSTEVGAGAEAAVDLPVQQLHDLAAAAVRRGPRCHSAPPRSGVEIEIGCLLDGTPIGHALEIRTAIERIRTLTDAPLRVMHLRNPYRNTVLYIYMENS